MQSKHEKKIRRRRKTKIRKRIKTKIKKKRKRRRKNKIATLTQKLICFHRKIMENQP